MQVLNEKFNLNDFLRTIPAAHKRILMLDYDGTLSPFVKERDKAIPYPGVTDLLNEIISKKQTRLVIITGRSIEDLKKLLKLNILPEIYGSHGLEWLTPEKEYRIFPLSEIQLQGIEKTKDWIEKEKLKKYSEKKPCGYAFHWRGADEKRKTSLRKNVQNFWSDIISDYDFKLHEFDGGLEFRIEGIDKGQVVNKIISDIDNNTAVAYLGDDTTDEDAFRALAGKGISVFVSGELRRTLADLWILPPGELLDFIRLWL